MLFGRGKDTQSRRVGGISSGLDIELFPQPANIFRLVVDNWEHPAKEEQVACLDRLDVSAKGRRGGWELNAKVLQPAVGCSAVLRAAVTMTVFLLAILTSCFFSPGRLANIIMIDSVSRHREVNYDQN